MGSCRRLVVAQALGAAIDVTTDVRERVELARTLGDVGNSWAWQTPGVTARHEEGQVRAEAATALLKAYLAWDGDAQNSAAKAVLVVDSPQTSTLIAGKLAHAQGKDAAALKSLADRVANNPLHRY